MEADARMVVSRPSAQEEAKRSRQARTLYIGLPETNQHYSFMKCSMAIRFDRASTPCQRYIHIIVLRRENCTTSHPNPTRYLAWLTCTSNVLPCSDAIHTSFSAISAAGTLVARKAEARVLSAHGVAVQTSKYVMFMPQGLSVFPALSTERWYSPGQRRDAWNTACHLLHNRCSSGENISPIVLLAWWLSLLVNIEGRTDSSRGRLDLRPPTDSRQQIVREQDGKMIG